MEHKIGDLLDALPEVEVDIRPNSNASAEHIKELTMKKIHNNQKSGRAGLSRFGKILIAAAILASLAIPVMAAGGSHFIDWLEGLGKKDAREVMACYNSWEETEGFWQISLTAKDVSRSGMTLNCREAQDSPVTGALEIHGGYWLEQWNGTGFEVMEAAGEVSAGADREIRDGDSFTEQIDWEAAYGQLKTGHYRLGKRFTYTFSNGETKELTQWAEFRIFNEDMTPYINRCKDAMDALLNRENSHITMTNYSYAQPDQISTTFTNEIWNSGGNHLMVWDVLNHENQTGGRWGELLLGDEAYRINSWNGEAISSGANQWQYDELLSLELNQFDIWYFYFTMEDAQIGEIWVEENKILVLIDITSEGNEKTYKQISYSFDEQGRLAGGQIHYLPDPYCPEEEKRLGCEMTVYDTGVNEIAAVIGAQNVGQPEQFAWEQEKQHYPAGTEGVKTAGFANTDPVTIESGYDAFMRAFGDYDVVADTYSSSKVYYDSDADIWKVEFWWRNGNVHAAVYMDGQGITQLTFQETME